MVETVWSLHARQADESALGYGRFRHSSPYANLTDTDYIPDRAYPEVEVGDILAHHPKDLYELMLEFGRYRYNLVDLSNYSFGEVAEMQVKHELQHASACANQGVQSVHGIALSIEPFKGEDRVSYYPFTLPYGYRHMTKLDFARLLAEEDASAGDVAALQAMGYDGVEDVHSRLVQR